MLHLRTLGGLKLSGPGGDSLSRRRNDVAVLAVQADRSPAAIRREEMQTLFWGERPEEKARHSLRQVVLQLRRDSRCPFGEIARGPTRETGSLRHGKLPVVATAC